MKARNELALAFIDPGSKLEASLATCPCHRQQRS